MTLDDLLDLGPSASQSSDGDASAASRILVLSFLQVCLLWATDLKCSRSFRLVSCSWHWMHKQNVLSWKTFFYLITLNKQESVEWMFMLVVENLFSNSFNKWFYQQLQKLKLTIAVGRGLFCKYCLQLLEFLCSHPCLAETYLNAGYPCSTMTVI